MPPASRLGDECTGHGCFPPRPSIEGSPDVYINGKPALRKDDAYAVHSCKSSHGGKVANGSGSVYINGKPAARIGDPIDCGSNVAQGSPNVIIGG